MSRGTLMQAMRGITIQVRAIEDHRRRHARRAVPIFPPMFDELTLVDNVIRQSRSDKRQIPVPIDRADCITQSRPMDTMNPVDPIEALHDSYPMPPRIS